MGIWTERIRETGYQHVKILLVVQGKAGRGRPSKRWREGVEQDLKEWDLDRKLARNIDIWKAHILGKNV